MPLHSISLLVVEGNERDRGQIKHLLEGYGCTVVEARNGCEALQAIGQTRFALICLNPHLDEADLEQLSSAAKASGNPPFLFIAENTDVFRHDHHRTLHTLGYLSYQHHGLEINGLSLKNALLYAEMVRGEATKSRELEILVNKRTKDLLCQNKSYEREILRRQEQEKKAQHAVNEWRRTMDALPEMIAIIDDERKFRRVNKPMLDFLNIAEEDLPNIVCSFCTPTEGCRIHQVVNDKHEQKFELYIEEKQKHLELNIVPYSSPDGDYSGSIHVFRDISERKSADKERERLQVKLLHAQKLESVGQLAAGIAHEINTPSQFVASNVSFLDEAFSDLNACLTELSETLTEGVLTAEQYTTALENIDWEYLKQEIPAAITQSKDGLTRISSIVRAMKEFSHPGSKEKNVHDINHLLDITVTVARNEWKYAANVELNLDPELPHIKCLTDELGQVFLNLLVNAAHAIQEKIGRTPEQEKGQITITTSHQDDWIEISIGDNGNGIPLHIQKKIFDPFFTTKAVGQGTGQGLAIAYDVITNKHQGALTFSTSPGVGTTFVIRLPRNQV